MSDELFDYEELGEAWTHFTKCARGYFARTIKKMSDNGHDDILEDIRHLRHKDYCARLMYVISFFTPDRESVALVPNEFDLDWAMLMAKPASVSVAKRAFEDLVTLGLIERTETNDQTGNRETQGEGTNSQTTQERPPRRAPKSGGETNPQTKFDFD